MIIFSFVLAILLIALSNLLYYLYSFFTIFIDFFFFLFSALGYHPFIMTLFITSFILYLIISIYRFISDFIS